MEIQTSLLNKKVVIYRKDGYVKAGVLRLVSDRFVILQYNAGREEIISTDSIISIKLAREERI